MPQEEQEKFISTLAEELLDRQRNGLFYEGCQDKLVDVEVRKESKSVKKLVQMKTKAREFTEDEQLKQVYTINSLL